MTANIGLEDALRLAGYSAISGSRVESESLVEICRVLESRGIDYAVVSPGHLRRAGGRLYVCRVDYEQALGIARDVISRDSELARR